VYCAAASSTQDEPCTSTQVITVNDEAIAMAALSSMADSVSSEQFAPSSEQIVPTQQHVSCELAPDQISSEHFTASSELVRSERLSDSVQMAIDLSSANVVASQSLT